MYKITIRLNDRDQIFTTHTYSLTDNRIVFYDKYHNKKNFSALPETLIGIEEAGGKYE